MVAYVGECVRHAIGGEWAVRAVDDRGTWEPFIRLEDAEIPVGVLVSNGLDEDEAGEEDASPSIATEIGFALNNYRSRR